MKKISAVVVAVALAGLLPLEGRASNVTWDKGQPTSPAAGQVSGTGTFMVDPGWTLYSLTITAVNANGGASDTDPCTVNAPAFSGLIVGLPTGSYYVYSTLTEVKGTGIQRIYSMTTTVPVLVPVK